MTMRIWVVVGGLLTYTFSLSKGAVNLLLQRIGMEPLRILGNQEPFHSLFHELVVAAGIDGCSEIKYYPIDKSIYGVKTFLFDAMASSKVTKDLIQKLRPIPGRTLECLPQRDPKLGYRP